MFVSGIFDVDRIVVTFIKCNLRSDLFQYSVFKVQIHQTISLTNGDGEIRTLDPLLARQVLSQLSYTPRLWNKKIYLIKWA